MASPIIEHNYGECPYWEKRYKKQPVAFDWYQGYWGLAELLLSIFPKDARLLQVGVGTSRLQEGMVRAGYQHVDNVDYSEVVIRHMAELHKDLPQLTYRVADVRQMPEIASSSYYGVIDKGTLDAILCGGSSGRNSMMMLAECCRVLEPWGVLVLVTYGDPASRLQYLDQQVFGWTVEVHTITQALSEEGEGSGGQQLPCLLRGPFDSKQADVMRALGDLSKVHYVYVCRKSPELIAHALSVRVQQPGLPSSSCDDNDEGDSDGTIEVAGQEGLQ